MKLTQTSIAVLAMSLSLSAWAVEPQPRIINGNLATAQDFPWQVALVTDAADPYQSYICSGTLLHQKWVVTAAHCATQLKNNTKGTSAVVVGSHDLSHSHRQTIGIKNVIIHEHFQSVNMENDIALLELKQPVQAKQCQDDCAPLALGQTAPDVGVAVQIAGWGITEDCEVSHSKLCRQSFQQLPRDPKLYPAQLRYTTLNVSHCLGQDSLYTSKNISQNMLCAQAKNTLVPTDTCFGDSGAGLVAYDGNNQARLVGIASWGIGCARQGYAGVYTKVANYQTWLDDKMNVTTGSTITPPTDSHSVSGGGTGLGAVFALLALARLRQRK